MKHIFLIVGLLIFCICTVGTSAFADNFSKESFSKGDFIQLKDNRLYWIENNRNDYETRVRQWQFMAYNIPWYSLEGKIVAVYKFGTPPWHEKAKEYLK